MSMELVGNTMINAGAPAFACESEPPNRNTQGQAASGQIASFMHRNGMQNIDPNTLYQMRNDSSVPPQDRDAANYMLQNPGVFKQIADHGNMYSEGPQANVHNMDGAAEGRIPLPPTGGGYENPQPGFEPQYPRPYQGDNGGLPLQRNLQYEPLSGDSQPPQVGYSQNPQVGYSETPQVGYSQTPQTGYGETPQVGYSQTPQAGYGETPQVGYDQTPQVGYGQTPQVGTPQVGFSQTPQAGFSESPDAAFSRPPDGSALAGNSLGQQRQSASRVLGEYMSEGGGPKTTDPNKLYEMATNKNRDTPPDVQQAASFMMRHLDQYHAIETKDDKQPDGISGAGNFLEDAGFHKVSS